MAKPKHIRKPIWAWCISRASVYAKLSALGGMADHAKTKIKPDWSWQGKLMLDVGSGHPANAPHLFEVRVAQSETWARAFAGNSETFDPPSHRVSVRCPKCYAWISFGKLHQHILSDRCLATADIAFRGKLPSIPALRCE